MNKKTLLWLLVGGLVYLEMTKKPAGPTLAPGTGANPYGTCADPNNYASQAPADQNLNCPQGMIYIG